MQYRSVMLKVALAGDEQKAVSHLNNALRVSCYGVDYSCAVVHVTFSLSSERLDDVIERKEKEFEGLKAVVSQMTRKESPGFVESRKHILEGLQEFRRRVRERKTQNEPPPAPESQDESKGDDEAP